MNITTFLNHLEKVKQTGADKWQACCPAHDDKSPSLAVKDTGDKILIHCFAGCTTDDITGALGLELADLYADSHPITRSRNKPPQRKLDDALWHEILVLTMAISARKSGATIHPNDKDREKLAANRVIALLKDLSS